MVSKLSSVGMPLPHQEVRIVDEQGDPVPTGSIGEIALRGPKVFAGYWRNPEATTDAIRKGWFHSGDMGYLDSDGYLYIADRKKDMVISGGENAVLEVAVIGHSDEKLGEVPMAFVVLREGHTAIAEDLIDFCGSRLAKFKIPRYIEFIDVLPRTPSGKVLERDMRVANFGDAARRWNCGLPLVPAHDDAPMATIRG